MESIKEKDRLKAYSEGLGKILCQCMNLGNAIGQGSGIGGDDTSNRDVSTCGCDNVVLEKRHGLRGFFGKAEVEEKEAKLNLPSGPMKVAHTPVK